MTPPTDRLALLKAEHKARETHLRLQNQQCVAQYHACEDEYMYYDPAWYARNKYSEAKAELAMSKTKSELDDIHRRMRSANMAVNSGWQELTAPWTPAIHFCCSEEHQALATAVLMAAKRPENLPSVASAARPPR